MFSYAKPLLTNKQHINLFYLHSYQHEERNPRFHHQQKMTRTLRVLSRFQKFQDQLSVHSIHWLTNGEFYPNQANILYWNHQTHVCNQSNFCKSPLIHPRVVERLSSPFQESSPYHILHENAQGRLGRLGKHRWWLFLICINHDNFLLQRKMSWYFIDCIFGRKQEHVGNLN